MREAVLAAAFDKLGEFLKTGGQRRADRVAAPAQRDRGPAAAREDAHLSRPRLRACSGRRLRARHRRRAARGCEHVQRAL